MMTRGRPCFSGRRRSGGRSGAIDCIEATSEGIGTAGEGIGTSGDGMGATVERIGPAGDRAEAGKRIGA